MSLHNVPIGDKAPEVMNGIVEIPQGSHNKYEYDEKLGVITLDRVLYSPMHYPADYGFIPETRCEDGDHLDFIVLGGDPTFPGCVVRIRPVGLIRMIDAGEEDFKLVCVQADNRRFDQIKDVKDIEASNPHFILEVTHFFERYKDLEKKEVKINGWGGKEEALLEIKRAQEAFNKE